VGKQRLAAWRFIVPSTLGLAFFMLPVTWGERISVPFDIVINTVIEAAPNAVAVYCLLIIAAGAVGTLGLRLGPIGWRARLASYRGPWPLAAARVAALPLALVFALGTGPAWLTSEAVAGLMWSTLAFSVGVIIPVGAALLMVFVRYGFLDFVGTLMRPIMRPLFRLPGRAALDSLTSWVGSYSVGLYLTRRLMYEGYYTRREAYTIATCFSTVSVGFVAVVADTLGLLHLFPLIFGSYFIAVYLLAVILVRVWPVAHIPQDYLGEPQPERPPAEGLLRTAWQRALKRADSAPGLPGILGQGLRDGLVLASTILGSILVVGTAALLLARETPVFDWLAAPLVPLLEILGLPDPRIIAPATLVGITEMYIPALLSQDAALPARFFIAVLSVSQLIFFSSVAPMILAMFADVPVRARELVALFLMRTVLLIPLLAGLTALLTAAGVLA